MSVLKKYVNYIKLGMPHKKEFGNKVRALRKQNGLSQEKFCRKANVNQSNLSGIETGKKNVTIDTIQKIANGFDVEIKCLFDKEN